MLELFEHQLHKMNSVKSIYLTRAGLKGLTIGWTERVSRVNVQQN